MKFRLRKTKRFGPFCVTVNQSGRLSFGIKIWRYTYSLTRRTSTFDTPGPGYVVHRHGRRKP